MPRQVMSFIVLFLFIFSLPYTFNYTFAEEGSRVEELQRTTEGKRNLIDRLKREISLYEQSLKLRRAQAASLANQIAILNDQIQKLELSIKLNEEQIEVTRSEIAATEALIYDYNKKLILRRQELSSSLRQLYARGQENDLFILFAHNTVADYFSDLERVEQLQTQIADIVNDLARLKQEAEAKQKDLEGKEKELNALKAELEQQQTQLAGQRTVKAQLLVDTRRSETKYQLQLEDARREQRAIESEVVSLEKKLREEIKKGDRLKRLQALGAPAFVWPIESRRITASFMDPNYPYRDIFEHPAIDVATRQGTPVRAAAGGYVAKARDGGLRGYSYVMIIHNNGYATVYGHVSKIAVQDDQFVEQGQIIAYSGGTPGTPGAGRLTTGPHVHFEIRLNGVPVDPMNYL